MALQKHILTEQGFDCPSAYLVITEVSYVKPGSAYGRLIIYKDKEARDFGKQELRIFNFAFQYDLNSPLNIIEQAYLAVKSNPEYSDSVDV